MNEKGKKIGYKDIFRQREYMKMILAALINRFGDSIDAVAAAWIVYEISGNAAWSAVIFKAFNASATASSTLLPVFSTKAILLTPYYLAAALSIIYCCPICIMFITTQYSTKPPGKVKLI